MASVITNDGATRLSVLAGNEDALVIDTMVLAMVPGLNTSVADPDQQFPDAGYIVHTYSIPEDYKGYVDPNQVVYSMILGTDLGDFEFNWVGLVEAVTGIVIAVTVTPAASKWATNLATNTVGNNITRNLILSYQDAQNLTGITVAAETWQFDYQAEINAHIAAIVDPSLNGSDPKHLTNSQAKVWQDHLDDTGNPHGVTKTQVGLSNIPNAISNSYALNSSSTLATSRALKLFHDIFQNHTSDNVLHTSFPAGTSMLFNQASAPTGWTKKSNWAANASLIVGNTYGSGGSDSPTSWRTAISVGSHADHRHTGPSHAHSMPTHNHAWVTTTGRNTYNSAGTSITLASLIGSVSNYGLDLGQGSGYLAGTTYTNKVDPGNTNAGGTGNTGYTSTSGARTHSVSQDTYAPKYQIVIAATKN
ncbi:phage tail protein [uncultured Desulfobacter sp.]|uniref:phage tail-collar fiber domain-containing protein n=1 Tax=uncultured Desulfobacter sp. TaxID=240139 RepID=UPI0029F4A5D9|nr:phage tail protein [uncultured Desulfobacter sp.]